MGKGHNLDIHMYSFEELLGLFNLSMEITIDDLKRAKKQVLMTHPDKSKLPSDYFLFYKKAFDVIVRFYETQNRQTQDQSEGEKDYTPTMNGNDDKHITKQVSAKIREMSSREFQAKFNKLFDDNMTKKTDNARHEWFTKDDPVHTINDQVNASNMGSVFERIKQTQSGLVRYKGVEHIESGRNQKYYDDDDDDSYATSDPFSKLKFDDLRKVHKDETVFAVSEKDIHKRTQYSSVDHMMRERGQQSLTPLEKQAAEHQLYQNDKQYREQMMQKEYQDKLRTMKYQDKNKTVLSSFLHLTNG